MHWPEAGVSGASNRILTSPDRLHSWQAELMRRARRRRAALAGCEILHPGDMQHRRVLDIALCARTVRISLTGLKNPAPIVTPVIRDDVIIAPARGAGRHPAAGLLLDQRF